MGYKHFFFAFTMTMASSGALAAQADFTPIEQAAAKVAPADTPQTKYCLRVDPITGSNVETIQCWTREEWAEQGVDVDKEWAKNGIRAIA